MDPGSELAHKFHDEGKATQTFGDFLYLVRLQTFVVLSDGESLDVGNGHGSAISIELLVVWLVFGGQVDQVWVPIDLEVQAQVLRVVVGAVDYPKVKLIFVSREEISPHRF